MPRIIRTHRHRRRPRDPAHVPVAARGFSPSAVYRPHRSATTPLYRVVQHHLNTFLARSDQETGRTVMAALSIVPAVGAVLVWLPAVVYLVAAGRVLAGIALLAWCAIVVGGLDNILRPRLIGRDARMSDLLVFLSTLGGILLFGAVGFIVGPIVGPIVAALFVTIWHIYGEVFHDWLPDDPAATGTESPG